MRTLDASHNTTTSPSPEQVWPSVAYDTAEEMAVQVLLGLENAELKRISPNCVLVRTLGFKINATER
jgi:hypothetical protein